VLRRTQGANTDLASNRNNIFAECHKHQAYQLFRAFTIGKFHLCRRQQPGISDNLQLQLQRQ